MSFARIMRTARRCAANMSQWAVLNALKQLTVIDDSETSEILPTCKSSLDELGARLKNAADIGNIRIIKAAAGAAYYSLMLKRLSGEESMVSFKAGDVTVSKSTAAAFELASKVREETIRAALPLLRDDEFLFKQVGI